MKLTIILSVLVVFALSGFSQTNNDLARAAYLNASDAYNSERYNDCVTELKSAISYLDTTNVRIQYLLSKAYFQLPDYPQAQVEIAIFFGFNPEINDAYQEILDISGKIDVIIQKQQAELAAKQAEEAAWKLATKGNTQESYYIYLKYYRNGKYSNEANIKIEDLDWNKALGSDNLENAIVAYMQQYPNGRYTQEAKKSLKSIENNRYFNNYRDSGNAAFNIGDWDKAIDNYNTALNYKPEDTYSKNQIIKAKNNKLREEYTLEFNKYNGLAKEYNRVGNSMRLVSCILIGIGTGAYIYSKNILVPVILAPPTIVGLSIAISNYNKAEANQIKADSYQGKIRQLTFSPFIQQNYIGYSVAIVF